MKKTISVIILTLLMNGCVSSAVTDSVKRNAVRLDKFVEKMDKDETTRDQEQKFIKSNKTAWHSLDYYLNGTKLPDDLKRTDD